MKKVSMWKLLLVFQLIALIGTNAFDVEADYSPMMYYYRPYPLTQRSSQGGRPRLWSFMKRARLHIGDNPQWRAMLKAFGSGESVMANQFLQNNFARPEARLGK